jgi:hypothetical protein
MHINSQRIELQIASLAWHIFYGNSPYPIKWTNLFGQCNSLDTRMHKPDYEFNIFCNYQLWKKLVRKSVITCVMRRETISKTITTSLVPYMEKPFLNLSRHLWYHRWETISKPITTSLVPYLGKPFLSLSRHLWYYTWRNHF